MINESGFSDHIRCDGKPAFVKCRRKMRLLLLHRLVLDLLGGDLADQVFRLTDAQQVAVGGVL